MRLLKKLFGGQNAETQKAEKFTELENFSLDEEMVLNMKATWLTSRGNHYGMVGKLQEAIKDFEEAISLKSDHLPAHFAMSLAYKELGDEKRALEIIEKAPNEMKLGGEVISTKESML